MEPICLAKYVIHGRVWFLLTIWDADGNGFNVTATDCRRCWRGFADRAKIEELAEGTSPDDYLRLTRKALTLPSSEELRCAVDTAGILSWGVRLTTEPQFWMTGAIELEEIGSEGRGDGDEEGASPPALEPLLSVVSQRLAALDAEAARLRQEKKAVSQQAEDTLARLSKLSEFKERLEGDMYKKFCVVLNEKKRKIQELRKRVADLESAPPPPPPPPAPVAAAAQPATAVAPPAGAAVQGDDEKRASDDEAEDEGAYGDVGESQQQKAASTFGSVPTPSMDLLGSMDVTFAQPAQQAPQRQTQADEFVAPAPVRGKRRIEETATAKSGVAAQPPKSQPKKKKSMADSPAPADLWEMADD